MALANELLRGAHANTRIAVVSAPSVFVQLKNLLLEYPQSVKPHIRLLEYDERFSVIPEFVPYDFHQPFKLDPSMKGKYDRVLCDPPFLSSDCQTSTAMTVRWLSKPSDHKNETTKPNIIVCTGERMGGIVHKLYPGLSTTNFQPRHAQDRLSNDFRCYANYDSALWT